MNWKQEAKDKLRKYAAMKVALVSIPDEIARLEYEFTAIRSARTDGTPVRGGTNVREDAIINNIAQRQELEAELKNAREWMRIVDRALQCLSEEDRMILERMYIHPEMGAVDQLCYDLNLEKSSVYRYRDKALQTFSLALYGTTGEDFS